MDQVESSYGWKWGQKSELARRAGISPQYLSDILNCRARASRELAEKLEKVSNEMKIFIEKAHFMNPQEAPEDKFNTPGAAKRKKVERMERWKDDRLFFYDYSQMLAGLASGRGRRPARQKMSKRDLRIIKMIAAEGVRLMKFQEAFDPAGAKQSRDKLCAIAGRPDLAASIRPPDVYQPPDIFQPAKTITIRL